MEPLLAKNDKIMFYKYLEKAKIYFEFGSGGSTYQANIRNNIKKIYSVESDIEWQKCLKLNLKKDNVVYIFNEMNTQPKTLGYPGKKATDIQKINYSSHMKNLSKEEQDSLELVFIDGRFRVACCLKCFDIIKDDCLIAFDDFLNRKHYHIVLDYFNVVEYTSDNRMVILRKKDNVSYIPQDIIKKYELIKE
jgi:predicted O-methyltransferase YrrM